MSRIGPCMCGATDCPSCGPAQGYEVVRRWNGRRYVYVNPEDGDEEPEEDDGPDFDDDRICDPDDYAADMAQGVLK